MVALYVFSIAAVASLGAGIGSANWNPAMSLSSKFWAEGSFFARIGQKVQRVGSLNQRPRRVEMFDVAAGKARLLMRYQRPPGFGVSPAG